MNIKKQKIKIVILILTLTILKKKIKFKPGSFRQYKIYFLTFIGKLHLSEVMVIKLQSSGYFHSRL